MMGPRGICKYVLPFPQTAGRMDGLLPYLLADAIGAKRRRNEEVCPPCPTQTQTHPPACVSVHPFRLLTASVPNYLPALLPSFLLNGFVLAIPSHRMPFVQLYVSTHCKHTHCDPDSSVLFLGGKTPETRRRVKKRLFPPPATFCTKKAILKRICRRRYNFAAHPPWLKPTPLHSKVKSGASATMVISEWEWFLGVWTQAWGRGLARMVWNIWGLARVFWHAWELNHRGGKVRGLVAME